MSERRRDDEEPKVELNVSLGGLFKGLGDVVNLIADLAQRGEELRGTLGGQSGQIRGVYGINIRTAAGGGGPRVEPFGNIRPSDQGPEVSDVREPLVDLFDEGAEMLVVAEVPGVEAAEISVELHGDVLRLETSGERRYAREILLPAPAEPASLRQSYRNGILELRMAKAGGPPAEPAPERESKP